ncbi:MAG TPA: two-component regulator propeller domain-containing protein [Chryseolinea sp.]
MKTSSQSGICCLLILFSVTQYSIAQNQSLRFEHIGIEEGFANTFVTAILQDRKGFLWVGTGDGLYKYDGYSFTKYQYDPLDPNSLSQNLIYTIFEDKAGTIWTSSIEGLCKFDRSTETFTRYKPSPDAIFSNPNIYSINEDTNGMLWVGSTTGELCRFDRKTGKFLEESFDLDFDRLPSDTAPSIGYINSIYKDQSGILWVGNSTGLHALKLTEAKASEPSAVSITHYRHDPLNPSSLSSNLVGSVIEDKAGIIWVATDNGLNSFDRKTGIFKRYRHDPKNSHSISSNNLVFFPGPDIKEDQDGNLWIGTDKGLNKLNKDRTIFTSYFNNPTDANSISSDIITSVEIDLAGILWAGAWNAKLNKSDLNKKAFGLNRHDPDNINSLSNNEVTVILEDAEGVIWIGTSGGGLNRWDQKNNQFSHYKHNPNNLRTLKHNYIGAILEDRAGNLWVCNGDVLSQFHKQTGEFTHYSDIPNNDNGEEWILSMTEDRQGLLWLGLAGTGIKSFDKKSGYFERYYHNPADTNGISDYVAIKLFADSKDNIWIGHTSMATDKFNKRTRRFTHYKHDPYDSTSISSNIVSSFYEDPEGNVWIGTSGGGLCYFDSQQEKFTTYTNKHGLPDNSVHSILNDNTNNLWLATGKGLSRFEPDTKTFTNYDYKDGLLSNFGGAALKGEDGTLYFGGDNGFNFFDPDKIKADGMIAPIVITQFKLFDKLIKGASELKEIVLDHDQNYFSFEFSSLSFYNPSKNQYAYKLEGFDKDWVYSGSRRYAGYTYVDPGTYTFKVKGTNSDGVWNETGTSIIINIRPPWWRTWWAYCFYGICFIAGIVIISRYQRRRVINNERERAREREMEQAHEIEKAYHELKATQAQLIQSEKMASLGELTAGIAHEIQNPLNFVNNFSDLNKELVAEMENEIEQGNIKEVRAIARSIAVNEEKINHHGKRADAIVKGMLQHSRSSSGQKELTDINALSDEYIRLSYHGLRAKDKSFTATIKTDFDENIGSINIIPQEIGRVILNLINNAFYAVSAKATATADSKYEPTVSISTKKTGNKILISVADNGAGIPTKVLDKIFQPFFTTKPTGQGTGLGLSLSYDIVKAHGGELKVETTEGESSTFYIELPTGTDT